MVPDPGLTLPLRAYTHDRGGFEAVRDRNVLIYWPHGFGDWVHLSYILPLLEPSNRYWITRFGSDNVSVFDGARGVTPVYLGGHATHEGDRHASGLRHFGIRYEDVCGDELSFCMPDPLTALCKRERIDTLLWTWYPETHGAVSYPFHSKPRHLLRHLVSAARCATLPLDAALPSVLSFDTPPWLDAWVRFQLRDLLDCTSARLCLVGRNGYTSTGKNWGHLFREDLPPSSRREGEECRDFMRLLLRHDSRWRFLAIEDRLFSGDDTVRAHDWRCQSYAELFGTPDSASIPYGLIMKSLLKQADLVVGVPAGPLHLAMAHPDPPPTVGIWIEHHPSWYDEPKQDSIHLIGRNVVDRGLASRPGSLVEAGALRYRAIWTESRIITGEQALGAVRLLGI